MIKNNPRDICLLLLLIEMHFLHRSYFMPDPLYPKYTRWSGGI